MDAELYDLEIDRTPGNVAKTGKRSFAMRCFLNGNCSPRC